MNCKTRIKKKQYCQSDMRHLVKMQKVSSVQDANFQKQDMVIKEYSIYGCFQDYNNDFSIDGRTPGLQATHKLIFRYYFEFQEIIDTSSEWRVEYENNFFRIQSVNNLDFDREWVVCKLKKE